MRLCFRYVFACAVSLAALGLFPVGSLEAQQSTHAIVPGFERFFTSPGSDAAAGGRLLLQELNCIACHQLPAESAYLKRSAPVLTDVGKRVRVSYLRRFLTDPAKTKPGTAMPNLLASMPEQERREKVEDLVHFLATTGQVRYGPLEHPQVGIGRQLYHDVGCVACHGSRTDRAKLDRTTAATIRFDQLSAKYTIPSLQEFLANPHRSRPSGRMPRILKPDEAKAVAHYLLQDIPAPPPNVEFAYFEGNWDKLPDFDKLKPRFTGKINGFDLRAARRGDYYGLRFRTWLKIDQEGDYRFFVTSDDGGRLLINGKVVVDNDGIHPATTKSGSIRLGKGVHAVEVQFFEKAGQIALKVDFQGPGLRRQPLASHVFLKGENVAKNEGKYKDEPLRIEPQRVARGRKLFATLGCASCHEMKQGGQQIISLVKAPPLGRLEPGRGCLSIKATPAVPRYALSKRQRECLAAAVKGEESRIASAEARIAHTMRTFNCYACHDRAKTGGPEEALDKFFTTPQPEMGDEGRIPPSLNLAGAKLQTEYFEHILENGADDRPYMRTRMPAFGLKNTGHLVPLFQQLDRLPPVEKVTFTERPSKIRAAARYMVSGKAFGCIKCHTFAGHKAEGIQGIDMTIMTKRVKHDWFVHYLLDPQKFRPGTRMPTSWPNGKSLLDDVLGGDAHKQIEAIWVYLSLGKAAPLPPGLTGKFIELIPDQNAVIYRNFIAGVSPRAIAVGYPEMSHLAFDADQVRLAMLWQGAFIDASRHWTGRGQGFQPPLGGNILKLPSGPTFAVLKNLQDPWPNIDPREYGYRFSGYRLTRDRRPTFLYRFRDLQIEDFPNAFETKKELGIRRELKLRGLAKPQRLYFRAAVGAKIDALGKGRYKIDEKWEVRIRADAEPVIRRVGNQAELLVPVRFRNGTAQLTEEIIW